jgi:2-phospho-L-lactate guanylyltransferase
MDWVVLLPVKRLDAAKGRLAAVLSAAERHELMRLMVRGAALAAAEVVGASRVALATSDPRAGALARELGIGCAPDAGLAWNEGLVHAAESLVPRPAAIAYLAGDLPLVATADVRALLDAAPPLGVAVARARDGGTNALALRPAGAIVPAFGVPGSAAAHVRRAHAAGLDARLVERPGLAFDLDTPADAAELARAHPGAPAAGVLAASAA